MDEEKEEFNIYDLNVLDIQTPPSSSINSGNQRNPIMRTFDPRVKLKKEQVGRKLSEMQRERKLGNSVGPRNLKQNIIQKKTPASQKHYESPLKSKRMQRLNEVIKHNSIIDEQVSSPTETPQLGLTELTLQSQSSNFG